MFSTRAETLAADLARLGIARGDAVILHGSYRSVRPVAGGPEGVLAAAMQAVGPEGLLVMPAFTLDDTDPALWREPPPPALQARLRRDMAPWRPDTPTSRVGVLAETFRRMRGVHRSRHPVLSFAAWGRDAEAVLAGQQLDDPYGVGSPLEALLARDAWVLLLGVDHRADTFIHHAERRAGVPRLWRYRFPVAVEGGAVAWREGLWHAGCSEGFHRLAPHVRGVTRRGRVGRARAELVRARDVVEAAVALLSVDDRALTCDDPACPGCRAG